MSDAALRRLIDPPLDAAARWFLSRKVGAEAVAIAAFVLGLAAIADIAYGHSWLGLALFALNRVLVVVASAMARAAQGSPRALEAALETLVVTGIPFGFALADPSRAIAAIFLVCALAGASAARIATAARSRLDLVESATLFIAFAVACLLPERFSLVAYVLGVAAFIATGARVASAISVSRS
jgi:hypothetical protein